MKHLEDLSTLYGEDLAHAQLKLEAEAYEIGERRFNEAISYKVESGQGADTNVARPLMAWVIPQFSKSITEFLEENASGRPGRKAAAFKPLRSMQPERVAMVALRTLLNCLLADRLVIQKAVALIGSAVEAEARFGRIRDADAAYFAKHTEVAIRQRNADFFKRAYITKVESNMVANKELETWDRWTVNDKFAVGLKCVEIATSLGIIHMYDENHTGREVRTEKLVAMTEQVHQWINQRKLSMGSMLPAWLPTVVPPKPWTGITSGGYYGRGRANPRFVRSYTSAIIKRYREVDMPGVYRSVNTIQATPWTINKDVLKVAQEVLFWPKPPIPKAPGQTGIELPDRIEGMNTDEGALKAWKREAARSYRAERTRRSRRHTIESTLDHAEKFSKFERIWFPHNVDFRGRVYAIPSFSPQGTDLTKGLLLLADPTPMGDTGEYWLRMHLANTAGFDKEPMDVRQKWTHDNEELILDTADNPLDNLWWAKESDSPFCFLAACMEFAKWKRSENPKEYRCGIAVAFDGTCSGIQHFSAMLRDEIGGSAVNLVPAEKPSDIYKIVADKVVTRLNEIAQSGSEDYVKTFTDEKTGEITEYTKPGDKTLAQQWLTAGVSRSVTKRSVMTLPYGSKKFGFADQLLEDTIRPAIESVGVHLFPFPSDSARFLAQLIWDALATTVVAAVGAMEWLQKAAAALASQEMGAHWVTPAGFPVWQEYRKRETKRIDTIICGSIRLTMTVATKNEEGDEETEKTKPKVAPLDKLKQVSSISPNFVHSMDGSHLMLTANRGAEQGIGHFAMIHDSYGTCPGNAGTLFSVVRETFVETYSQRDVIEEFYKGFEQLLTPKTLDRIPPTPPKGDLDIDRIRDSLYCFG